MAIEIPAIPSPPQVAPVATATSEASDFDKRWAAWRARGAAHDRAVRRKMAIVAPMLIVVLAALIYMLLGR